MKSLYRPRRLRSNSLIRSMVQENFLLPEDLIQPLFIVDEVNAAVPIISMPGQFRLGLSNLSEEIKKLEDLGIKAVALFPAIQEHLKTSDARESYRAGNLNQRAIEVVKKSSSKMLVMSDVALDPYSSDGHDGLVDDKGNILNDESLEVLGKMSLLAVKSGADILGPSDMMDGRVGHIRNLLEEEGHKNTLIMSYTAKYASAFYGPFREALDSAPKKGDKKSYQMNPANKNEALIEAKLDEAEGADILMVKPGLPYLDIIHILKENSDLPIAAYHVSGEYSMIMAAAEKGWIDQDAVMMESLLSFKRAGADIILTYFAKKAAQLLQNAR